MPFTTDEMNAVANYVLNYQIKGDALAQTIQDKPLLKALWGKKKSFPGGKGKIDTPVKGTFLDSDTDFFKGFKYDDTVTFQNPKNVLRATYDWSQIHAGITVTGTELMQGGIRMTDTNTGKGTSSFTEQEKILLTDLWKEKVDDLMESWNREMNQTLWNDGTQDSGKQFPGITAYIVDSNSGVTTGGLARNTYAWWRNRIKTGLSTTSSGQAISKALRSELRQLKRYGGKPDLWLAGSAFLEALENEITEKSSIFVNAGDNYGGARKVGEYNIVIPGVGTIQYDPTLDDLGTIKGDSVDYSKRCYAIDTSAINLYHVQGEEMRTHTPSRPENKFAMYQSLTFAGGTCVNRLNGCGLFAIS